MTTLNRAAAEVLERLSPGVVHACTDITGFGLIGHACEVAVASGCALELEVDAVPLLSGARELAAGNLPGGGRTNLDYFGAHVATRAAVDGPLLNLLYDPQTSGGLLVAIAAPAVEGLLAALAEADVPAAVIGRAVTAVRDAGAAKAIRIFLR